MGVIRRQGCDPCRNDWKEKINQLWNNYQDVVKSVTLNGSRKTPDGQGNVDLGTVETEVEWGDIEGTLADQTDLKDALDAKADSADLATVATTGDYDDLSDKPDLSVYARSADLATVATTGAYADLSGTPTIPPAQVQSDWTQTDTDAVDYIKNKPTIPAGVTLYSSTGQNTDGAMTQKATTDALDDKLDKQIVTAGSFVYGTTAGNPSVRFQLTGGAFVNTIPYRQSNGTIETGTPTANEHATTKLYVDTALAAKLDKVTYEWNKELSVYASNKILIFSCQAYDSNITIDIDSTTTTAKHGTLVIPVQNYVSRTPMLYGDPTGDLANMIYIKPATGATDSDTKTVAIYMLADTYSKNLIHIRGVSLSGTPQMPQVVSDIPADATQHPTNASGGGGGGSTLSGTDLLAMLTAAIGNTTSVAVSTRPNLQLNGYATDIGAIDGSVHSASVTIAGETVTFYQRSTSIKELGTGLNHIEVIKGYAGITYGGNNYGDVTAATTNNKFVKIIQWDEFD